MKAGSIKVLGRVGLMVLMLAAVASAAVACGRGHHHRHHGDMSPEAMERRALDRVGWVLDDIDATDKQRQAIEGQVKTMLPKAMDMRATMEPRREALVQELLSGKPNAQKVRGMVDEASVDMTAFAHQMLDEALVAHAVLNKAQRAELAERFEMPQREWEGGWMVNAAVGRVLDKFDASDAQSELVLSHVDQLETEIPGLMKVRHEARAEFVAQLRSDKPDAQRLHQLIDQTAATYTEAAHKVAGAAVEIGATLTTEQRSMIQEKIAERRGRK